MLLTADILNKTRKLYLRNIFSRSILEVPDKRNLIHKKMYLL